MTNSDARASQRITPTSTPRWLDLLITALGLLSLLFFAVFYDQAFPSAALDLSISSAEIKQRAHTYLRDQGYDLDGYKSVVTFGGSSWSSYYLQRTLGIPQTNELIQEANLPIWYWRVRWFRPLQKEEFRVYLAPDTGDVVALSHTVLEDAPGASLSQAEARTLAEGYLSEDRRWDLGDWEEVSASSNDRPGGRTDHYFSWKRREWDVGESQLRLSVQVQGAEIGYYDYWLKTPEAFQRRFAERQDLAGFVDGLSSEASRILSLVIVLVALWKARWRVPRSFKRALWPALAVAGVIIASELNQLPLAKAWYGTTEDYRLYWLNELYAIAYEAISDGLYVFLLWVAGHWLSKQVWPRQDRILARRGHRWAHLARSGWRGLMLGMLSAGYLVLFYLIVTQLLGGWIPMTPQYTFAYATPLPFLSAFEVGLVPAMTEELLFRLILISGVLWLTRTFTPLPERWCRLLALVVPGALWGFAHTTYVRDPFYLRGIELTLSAILLEGLFFLRFGLATTIVAHFAYNAGLGALPLLRSGEPFFVFSGGVVLLSMLAPVLPYLIWRMRHALRGKISQSVQPHIRGAREEDLPVLETLSEDPIAWEALLTDEKAVVLCLQAEHEVIGVAAGRLGKSKVAEVLTVYVTPGWRRRYWGSELLVELRAQLQARGAETICLQVDVEDKPALNFMLSQPWKKARMTFRWPFTAPVLTGWRRLLNRIGLKRFSEQDRPQETL
jgi:membrane protease YdiL (CAAX protease family)